MILSKSYRSQLIQKEQALLKEELPVKVIQFGTGVLLRALPDYLIDKANKSGVFNGKIIVVKSTTTGSLEAFRSQDSLYTVSVSGISNGRIVQEHTICEAIDTVYDASYNWPSIQKAMENPHLQIVLSNTTEAGIEYLEESIDNVPPLSFPGKLLSLLYYRYQYFKGENTSGMIIIPTELLPDNGKVLKSIIQELAVFNQLDQDFMRWLEEANTFCNSLVDRIVPGKPDQETLTGLENTLGYKDELLITAEPYLLWAIEGDEKVKSVLKFERVDQGVIVLPDISRYRELKLRLLNGTHTLLCGLAVIADFKQVNAAMNDIDFELLFVRVTNEIALSMTDEIDYKEKNNFISDVRERFKNPFMKHPWLSICTEYTTKLKSRVVPLLLAYQQRYREIPAWMSAGFASYLFFMKSSKRGENFYGATEAGEYLIKDSYAAYIHQTWIDNNYSTVAYAVFSDTTLWGLDLTALPGFIKAVNHYLELIIASPDSTIIKQLLDANGAKN